MPYLAEDSEQEGVVLVLAPMPHVLANELDDCLS